MFTLSYTLSNSKQVEASVGDIPQLERQLFPTSVIPPKNGVHRGTLIYFHPFGVGSSRYLQSRASFAQNGVRLVLPNAPCIPITSRGSRRHVSWVDYQSSFSSLDIDPQSLEDTRASLALLLESEARLLGRDGHKRLLVGGLGQGCAVALHTVLLHPTPVAGFLGVGGHLLPCTPPEGSGRLALHFCGSDKDARALEEQTLQSLRPFHSVTCHASSCLGSQDEAASIIDKVLESDCIRCMCEALLKLPSTTSSKRVAASLAQATIRPRTMLPKMPSAAQEEHHEVIKAFVYRPTGQAYPANRITNPLATAPYKASRGQISGSLETINRGSEHSGDAQWDGRATELASPKMAPAPKRVLQPTAKQRAGVAFQAPPARAVPRGAEAQPESLSAPWKAWGPRPPSMPPPAGLAPKCLARPPARLPSSSQAESSWEWEEPEEWGEDLVPEFDEEQEQDRPHEPLGPPPPEVLQAAWGSSTSHPKAAASIHPPPQSGFRRSPSASSSFAEGEVLVVDDDEADEVGGEVGGEAEVEEDVPEAAEWGTFQESGAVWQILEPQAKCHASAWQPKKRARR
ncbi:unnamed protein product [Polarella glacialis]|uniref:Phospholipase/carboxylesterase/thioesterase domain-containing protein n=1 Tax=Polarella glacialis TaxID=89957 RepID=A0A813LY97_POLGL|nr:unnamed protein product [Polarella glacialis]